tara:strand:+ start:233 stop:1483 length:1251 start_codon:yes stop_codon:yes gene_type:complete
MRTSLEAVRVREVILNNETNPKRYNALGKSDAVGTILYTKLNTSAPDNFSTDTLSFAKPLFSGINQYPVVNEIVYLVRGPSEIYYEGNTRNTVRYYLPPIKIYNHPLHNAFPDILVNNKPVLSNEELEAGAQNSKNEYSINLGEYFKEIEKIRPLRPYEGDTIIEGRYGNSIRFGATTYNQLEDINRWSNEGEIGNPITIIRNGQKEEENKESFEHIVEDIDNDDSSIYLCSNQQISDFIPASLYQLSFGANLIIEEKIEPIIQNEPLPEEVEEDIPLVSPPPLPPEPEEIPEEIVEEDIADYDISPTEAQTIFPGDDLGDLPESYENPTGIDVERPLGPQDPPPIHADAEESYTPDSTTPNLVNGPYGFYVVTQGPKNKIVVKDKDMITVYDGQTSFTASISILIQEAKIALGIL